MLSWQRLATSSENNSTISTIRGAGRAYIFFVVFEQQIQTLYFLSNFARNQPPRSGVGLGK